MAAIVGTTNRRTRKPCSPKPSGARVAKVRPWWVAVGEEDRDHEIVPVPGRLQVRDDVEAVVRGLSEVEEQPFPGAVNVGERALVVDHPIAVGAMREEARGRALLLGPDAPDAGVLGVQEVDRRHDPVDRDA